MRLTEQEAIGRFLSAPGEESFRDLFQVIAPRAVRYFRTRGCDPNQAEDLTQEVMLTVYNHSRTLRNKESFRPWLFRIMKNALLQQVRRTGREVDTVTLDQTLIEPSSAATDPLAGTRFNEWMAPLEPDERQIMTLRYVEQLEYHEIAEVLEIPIGTVQWKVFRSKRKLTARFGGSAS